MTESALTHPPFSTPLAALDAVVLDTETTGLDAALARIVQIGAVRITSGAIDHGELLDHLIDPGVPIPPETTRVHGIDAARVAGAPRFPGVIAAVEAFVGPRLVIGHAIAYDITVLKREYALAARAWPGWRTLDVRHLARIALPGLAEHSLDRLCEHLEIEVRGRHTARGDAKATAQLFLALLPLLRTRGVRTLAEARAQIARQTDASAVGLDGATAERTSDRAAMLRIDSFAYRHKVRDVMSAPPVFLPAQTTLADAIRVLLGKGISSAFIEDGDRRGIVTERDLLRAVSAGHDGPVSQIMKSPLATIGADDHVYRAIGRMTRLGFRHLGVSDETGAVVGAVTTRNLLRHRATTAILLGDEIDTAQGGAGLAAAWSRLPTVARSLLAEDVDPLAVSGVVSAEICAMTRRAAILAEEAMARAGHGLPPVPYCVLVLGSAGRGESQLAPDQDNAIVFASGAPGGVEDTWFAAMAERMNTLLDEGGIPLCKGGVMARNPAWRMSLDGWQHTIEGWMRRQRPQDILNVDIFFDAIPVHGERALGEQLWHGAIARAHRARDFQVLITESTRARASPYTMFGNLRLDANGRIDLKKHGLMTIFSAARVLAIRHDLHARATADRVRLAVAAGHVGETTADAILTAHRTLLGLVIGQQLTDIEAGIQPSVRVAAGSFGAADKAALKDAFAGVSLAADLVSEGRI
ncbi:MAG: CBS domain-containing protein [Hyphomicrobiales bacterium]|nr:CBS domain-containing protein [Hyphomicrobiales bacterium]